MVEGIRFNSESFDDETSSESDKDIKKKKKKAGNVGKAIVGGAVGETAKAEKPAETKNIFEQLRGWLSEESPKKNTNETSETAAVFAPKTGRDIENMPVAASADEEAAIERAKEVLSREATDVPFENFRHQLTADELSQGEGIINLHAEQNAENLTDEAIFQRSVERDLSMIETVESDDEERAIARAPQVLNRLPRASRRGGVLPVAPNPNAYSVGNPESSGTGTAFGSLLERRLAIENARAAGHARGLVEGAVAGAVVAGGLEHTRHARREKAVVKKLKAEQRSQKKAVEELRSTTGRLNERQETIVQAAAKDRFSYEAKIKEEMGNVAAARTSEAAATARALAAEKARADTEKGKAELIERLNAQAAEQERLAAEAQLKDPEHRIETSAWHAMEVDKSGHIVEDSTIEYGHEYYRERAHETGPKEQIDAKAGSAAVAAALFASGGPHSQTETSNSATVSKVVPQKAGLPPLVGIDSQTDVDENSSTSTSFAGIIPMIIVLIIIIAALFMLL